MTLLKWSNKHGLCCPSRWLLIMMRTLGNEFTGFEIGHFDCGTNDARHEEEYGFDDGTPLMLR